MSNMRLKTSSGRINSTELATAAFNARVIPCLAYTDPEAAWVGLTDD